MNGLAAATRWAQRQTGAIAADGELSGSLLLSAPVSEMKLPRRQLSGDQRQW
jgi:hypothetical protein